MGSVSWRANSTLGNCVRIHPQHFDYYQLINLLLNLENKGDETGLDAAETEPGDVTAQIDRAVRIRTDIRFDFPPSRVSYYRIVGQAGMPALGINDFGIAGIYGPLPQAYTEWLQEEIANSKHHGIADFLDIFNHRLLSLRYQVRARTRVSLSMQKPNESPVAVATNAIMGFGNKHLFEQLTIRPRLLQTYAGLLANSRGSMQTVKALLGSVFSTQVTVEQLTGQWRRIEPSDQTRIGASGGRNHALGVNTMLGTRIWDQQGMITLTLGPLSWQRLLALMPGGALHAQLVELIQFLSNRRWDCRVRLLIARGPIPAARLSARPAPQSDGDAGPELRLGRTAWLKSAAGADGTTGFTVRVH
jgi:type VI secretion system protein ImpH